MFIKRRYARYEVERPAKIKIEGEKFFIDCHIKNLNFRGMQVLLPKKIPKDKFLKLVIILSSDFTLDVEAWVSWQKIIDGHYIYGLYFASIRDSDKEKIYRYAWENCTEELTKRWWQGTITEKGGGEMEDRRIFARFATQLPLRFLNLNSGKEGQAHTVDISAKGVGFVTNEEISSNTPLELWLQVPDKGEPYYTRGEVAWSQRVESDRYRVGINLEKADFMGMSRVLRTVM
jgi:hypothetical protein